MYILIDQSHGKTNNSDTSETLGGEDILRTLYYRFKYGNFFYIIKDFNFFIRVPRTM